MLKLNLDTGFKGSAADRSTEITIKDFWEKYILMLLVRNPTISLSSSERKVLIYVLCQKFDSLCFKGAERKNAVKELKMTTSNLTKIKDALVGKSFLEEGDTLGDTILTRSLRKFQQYIQTALEKNTLPEISFQFVFKIKNESKGDTK